MPTTDPSRTPRVGPDPLDPPCPQCEWTPQHGTWVLYEPCPIHQHIAELRYDNGILRIDISELHKLRSAICLILGLPPDAADDEILDQLRELQNA